MTTTVYVQNDAPALSLAGTKQWWPRKMLEQFAVANLSLPVAEIKDIIERLETAVRETRPGIAAYIAEHPEFKEIGERMMAAWEEGCQAW